MTGYRDANITFTFQTTRALCWSRQFSYQQSPSKGGNCNIDNTITSNRWQFSTQRSQAIDGQPAKQNNHQQRNCLLCCTPLKCLFPAELCVPCCTARTILQLGISSMMCCLDSDSVMQVRILLCCPKCGSVALFVPYGFSHSIKKPTLKKASVPFRGIYSGQPEKFFPPPSKILPCFCGFFCGI